MARKLNKDRALKVVAMSTPDRKVVKVPERELMDMSLSDTYVWDKYFGSWVKRIELKYGRKMELITWTDQDFLSHDLTIITEVKK